MPTWSRRRIETILLAMLAIAAVIPLRAFVEPGSWFLSEMGCLCIAFLIAESTRMLGMERKGAKSTVRFATYVIVLSPIVFGFAARAFGSPIPFEMSALAAFGSMSLAMATSGTTKRTWSLSLVISGFLVLFCASISDDRHAVVLPLIWMLGCVWHLIANHWERLELAMPDSVQRNWSLRPSTTLVALAVLIIGGFAARDRFLSKRLTVGWMPTSGGNEWSDPAARSGVGSGDAAIAAKDHPESFGAVDSDLFLESTEPTLFDMFNDMIGEPKPKKNRSERAQAMGDENFIPSHERSATSDQGGGTFSTERMPPKKHQHFQDVKEAGVVQWDGPTGIRLAMQRYDTFDGRDWSQSADLTNEKLLRVDIHKAPWFFDPKLRSDLERDPDSTSVGQLKVIRLGSPRIPAPMLTAGVHIKDIDRQDFFGISEDGSLFMPGREKVPPMTVLHLASVQLMEDEICTGLTDRVHKQSRDPSIDLLLDQIIGEETDPYKNLCAIVEYLRSEFTFSRDHESSATTLAEFLQTRCGADHLFATTAALMTRRIGIPSRLATGFYVRPDAFEITAGHSSVMPHDVHVWVEVQLDDGRWFEIEPTPGYEPPGYQPSWRLLAFRFAAVYWPNLVGSVLALTAIYVARRIWIDWLLVAVWSLVRWLPPQPRIRVAIRIIEMRARLAGQVRPVGVSQRAWLEQLTNTDAQLAIATRKFSDAADVLFFGRGRVFSDCDATALVNLLRIRTIMTLSKETTP